MTDKSWTQFDAFWKPEMATLGIAYRTVIVDGRVVYEPVDMADLDLEPPPQDDTKADGHD